VEFFTEEEMNPMKLDFFDCSCQIGARSVVYPGSFTEPEALVSAMQYYGIQKALVYHSLSREYHAGTGNDQLMEAIKAYPTLLPVWCVMPSHTAEFAEPEELAARMKTEGVKAVILFPADHGYSLSPWNSGELLRSLESHGALLLLELVQVSWDGLHDILERYPRLNIVLTRLDYDINRNLYPLVKVFPQLYLETSGVKAHRGIEDVCARFGAGRLVFGSGMPVLSGGAAAAMVQYASIGDDEKDAIAHGNLERLLGGALV
jgi:predicted TIM-barrel fold metal-dependent hydrolase